MYYEEKMINGVLCWRGNPDDDFTPYTLEELSRKFEDEQKQKAAIDEISCRRYEEILELRAQLARCVELILNSSPGIWVRERRLEEAGAWTNQAIKLIEDAGLKRAKADAEVLRCAEAYANFELELEHTGAGKPDTAHAEDLIAAVRAAKEAGDE